MIRVDSIRDQDTLGKLGAASVALLPFPLPLALLRSRLAFIYGRLCVCVLCSFLSARRVFVFILVLFAFMLFYLFMPIAIGVRLCIRFGFGFRFRFRFRVGIQVARRCLWEFGKGAHSARCDQLAALLAFDASKAEPASQPANKHTSTQTSAQRKRTKPSENKAIDIEFPSGCEWLRAAIEILIHLSGH